MKNEIKKIEMYVNDYHDELNLDTEEDFDAWCEVAIEYAAEKYGCEMTIKHEHGDDCIIAHTETPDEYPFGIMDEEEYRYAVEDICEHANANWNE